MRGEFELGDVENNGLLCIRVALHPGNVVQCVPRNHLMIGIVQIPIQDGSRCREDIELTGERQALMEIRDQVKPQLEGLFIEPEIENHPMIAIALVELLLPIFYDLRQ